MKEMIYKKQSSMKDGREVLDSGISFGFNFYIISFGSHPCCYVEIPDNHPLYLEKYDDIEIDCHGGLTFSSSKLTGIDETGLKWFIGWDFAHCDDYYCSPVGSDLKGHKWTLDELICEVDKVCKQLKDWRIKKMRVIDILNKLANGEEGIRFLLNDEEYYIGCTGILKNVYGDVVEWVIDDEWLNQEVQLIEDKEPKQLEKITFLPYSDKVKSISIIAEKVNEIIDQINNEK